MRESGPLVFDWSDGCLAPPLVSVTPILEWDDPPPGAREAYLERLGAPLEAYDDAVFLGLAHQLVSYGRILRGIAPHLRWSGSTCLRGSCGSSWSGLRRLDDPAHLAETGAA